MRPRLKSTRRQNTAHVPDQDDIRWDLAVIALDGFLPIVVLSGLCLVSATALAAGYYQDSWLWVATAVGLIVSSLRIATIYSFAAEAKKTEKKNYAFWSALHGITAFLFSMVMAFLNIYSIHMNDRAVLVLCVMGSFTLRGGIMARQSISPLVSQACIILLQGSLTYALILTRHPLIRYAAVLSVVAALTSCVSIEHQHSGFKERVRSKKRLKNLATHDWLTGLPNRHLFETTFEKTYASGKPYTLWMLDLDGFKGVNDTYGHAVGDELLRQVGQRLERCVRTGDLLARLGGDEFVILQPQAHAREVTRKLAERIGATISAPYLIAGNKIVIGASVGIKLVETGELDPDSALLEVDRALYRVKDFSHGGFEMV